MVIYEELLTPPDHTDTPEPGAPLPTRAVEVDGLGMVTVDDEAQTMWMPLEVPVQVGDVLDVDGEQVTVTAVEPADDGAARQVVSW